MTIQILVASVANSVRLHSLVQQSKKVTDCYPKVRVKSREIHLWPFLGDDERYLCPVGGARTQIWQQRVQKVEVRARGYR